jgi:hypothetical protein
MNKHAYDAFVPTLDTVAVLEDPSVILPDPAELAKRERMRKGWKADRARKKQEKSFDKIFEKSNNSG